MTRVGTAQHWRKLEALAHQQGRHVADGGSYIGAVADVMVQAFAWHCIADDGIAEELALGDIVADAADGIKLDAQRRVEDAVRPLIQNRENRDLILATASYANRFELDWPVVREIVAAMMQVSLQAARRRMAHA